MIRIPGERTTDYYSVERALAALRSPVELREWYEQLMQRYLELNTRYLFSESFAPDYVRTQVARLWSLRERELFAIPFGVKDVFNTDVLPTGMGSEIWHGFSAGNNARIVDEVADRGGVIFAKTTTAEFAVHYIQAGKTLNPHDPRRITGTSSAGSAVAVACGALPICLGTQTAGSIVRPASFCGVYGFKPSFGAFDRTGTLKTTDTLDTIGLIGSDIYGLRRAFAATFQKDPQYPTAKNYFERLARFRERKSFRIGVLAEQFSGYAGYDAEVREHFERAVASLGAAQIEVSRLQGVDFINEIHELHGKIYCKSLSYYFQQELQHQAKMSAVMADMMERGSKVSTADYVAALKLQPAYRARFDSVIGAYDFLLTPSTASVAPLVGQQERKDTCLIWTFLGYPVLSLPAFWSEQHNMPFGLQVVAPKFCDLPLLDFAERLVELWRRPS